jgi:hypothetical protein
MRRTVLATIALSALAAPMIAGSAAQADPYKWCAVYSGRSGGGGTNCGFVTYQQCMATVSGAGGYCQPNPRYTGKRR